MSKYIISLTYKDGRSETICTNLMAEQEISVLFSAIRHSFSQESYGVLDVKDKWGGFNLVRLSELRYARFYKEKENDLDKQED